MIFITTVPETEFESMDIFLENTPHLAAGLMPPLQ
jgi:hypothetical protein